MFPTHSGVYFAKKKNDVILLKIKGVYPSLKVDENAINISAFLSKNGVFEKVSKETISNIELFHETWNFYPLDFIDFSVFSNINFKPDGTDLYITEDDCNALRSKYYRFCQQGVSPLKVIKALSYEFKVSTTQIMNIINKFDEQAKH